MEAHLASQAHGDEWNEAVPSTFAAPSSQIARRQFRRFADAAGFLERGIVADMRLQCTKRRRLAPISFSCETVARSVSATTEESEEHGIKQEFEELRIQESWEISLVRQAQS